MNEYGKTFKTGKPVTFKSYRGTKGAQDFGPRYQQNIEPRGIYLVHNPNPGEINPGWATGTVKLRNPLVIPFNADGTHSYNSTSWKAALYDRYGLKGRALTRALVKDGHDGIVTVMKGTYTSEIVVLVPARYQETQQESCRLSFMEMVAVKLTPS